MQDRNLTTTETLVSLPSLAVTAGCAVYLIILVCQGTLNFRSLRLTVALAFLAVLPSCFIIGWAAGVVVAVVGVVVYVGLLRLQKQAEASSASA